MGIKIELPEVKSYPPAYHQIVKALRLHGVSEIGPMVKGLDGKDIEWRQTQERFRYAVPKLKEGDTGWEIRAASMDMDKISRVCRTVSIIELSLIELEAFHNVEKTIGRFILNIEFALKKKPNVEKLSELRINSVSKFNEDNRPEPEQFNGVSIPPYFPLDNYFDGMEYHHAWDKTIHANKLNFDMPDIKEKSSKKILDETDA